MIIVIPAYKPDEKLIFLIRDLKNITSATILIVDDGGKAPFAPVFDRVREMGCTVLVHPENRGKGAALKTAFQYISENYPPEELVCTADADGQHLPKDIIACLHEAEKHPRELILGSRAFKGNVPFKSRLGNAFSRWTFHLLIGTRVYDTQTGLRAFSAALCPFLLSVEGNRYEYEMQMLSDCCAKKIAIREITIDTVYLDENSSSHFNAFHDAWRVYKTLLKSANGRIFQFFKFLFSSGIAWFVDIFVYSLLLLVFTGYFEDKIAITLSLLLARCSSSIINYAVNCKVVFRNTKNKRKTFTLYALLVVLIYFGNNWLTVFFAGRSVHKVLSLIIAEIICCPASFLIQKYLIFPKKKG